MTGTAPAQPLFAGARARTLAGGLLRPEDRENLKAARGVRAFTDALYDTFLAPHLSREGDDIARASSRALRCALELLREAYGDGPLVRILFLRHDIDAITLLARAARAGRDLSLVEDSLPPVSVIGADHLVAVFYEKTAEAREEWLRDLAREISRARTLREIDAHAARAYYAELKRLARDCSDRIVLEYVRLHAHVNNIHALLRAGGRGESAPEETAFGGPAAQAPEELLFQLSSRMNSEYWEAAFSDFRDNGNFRLLEEALSGLVRVFARDRDWALESPAPAITFVETLHADLAFIRGCATAGRYDLPPEETSYLTGSSYAGR